MPGSPGEKMEERDWRQADLARRAGLSGGALSNILNDNRNPGPEVLTAIAKAFDEPPELVFRIAGILPPLPGPDDDLTLKELYDLARRLSPTERRRLARVARLYLREQNELYDTADSDTAEGTAPVPAT